MISLLLSPVAFNLRARTPPASATRRAGAVGLMEGMGMGMEGPMHIPDGNSGSSARGGVPDAMYGGMRNGMPGGMGMDGMGGMGGMGGRYGRQQGELGRYGGALRRGERRPTEGLGLGSGLGIG